MFEKEAEEYAKLNARQYIHNDGIGFCTSTEEVKQAYLAGAEPREKRIAELKADNDARKFAMAMSEKVEKQLQEKIADLKEEINEIAFARGELEQENESLENVKNIYIGDLIKARKIIKDYMIVATGDHTTVCSVPEENRCINVLKLNEQAKQFLKDSEVEK